MSPDREFVHVETLEGDRVLEVRIDRPKGNVLDQRVMRELKHVLRGHQDHRALKLVLLRAEGRHFSFGASVEEHRRDQAPAMLESFHNLMRRVAGFPVPIAALVQGQCLGGAFELALCAHFVLATADAEFACPEIKLGVFPPVLAVVGPHRLGAARTERMLLTGEKLGAEAALAAGFVSRIVDGRESALEWYREQLAPLSASSLRIATRVARESSGLLDALGAKLRRAESAYVETLLRTHDANEGVEAFLEKRPPVWRDA